MTVSSYTLVKDLQKQVHLLEDDLRRQAESLPELASSLRAEYAAASTAGRTAEAWPAWLDAQVTQAAVAWVLGCVFVRFCEDNDLVDRRWLAGIADTHGDGLARAVDAQGAWIQANPRDNERGWLREAFSWLRATRAGAALVDEHNPVWRWDVSADAAAALLGFLRRRDADGRLVHSFESPIPGRGLDTRFLGDLYQDLSEAARKRYALLQTPVFVEEFILDRTLTPALDEFGLDGLRLIDPTCGSGHFLLGAFDRLYDAWTRQAPGMGIRERIQAALDSVHGVDVNPFATAIAKFRLVVAALSTEGLTALDSAPAYRLHIGTGDSLLWEQGRQGEFVFDEGLGEHQYATEDLHEHPDILKPGRYHVVVGNPPYITVKDKALKEAYRRAYTTCHGLYALSVPFAEALFRLAQRGHDMQPAGFVGQITSNSFMKREFGKKLIEEFFPTVDLTHVVDTSGAYIPGHGTPTVILVGRQRYPRTETVRAVLGVRGEPSAPSDPGKGLVWTSIVENLDKPGATTAYVTIAELPRSSFASHPWSISGGGASDLMTILKSKSVLGNRAMRIGLFGDTHADEAFTLPTSHRWRSLADLLLLRPSSRGDQIRDWSPQDEDLTVFPYTSAHQLIAAQALPSTFVRTFWPVRTELWARGTFGGGSYRVAGRQWWEWHQLPEDIGAHRWAMPFAFVVTHNHFVLDRGGKVFNRSAPVIKLPAGASEDDHLRLLGLLNSSTACFWLKQVSHSKGNATASSGMPDQPWSWNWEFTGTKLQEFPLPGGAPLVRARALDRLAQELSAATPAAVCADDVPTRERLVEAQATHERIRGEMIGLQEELDWEVYRLYGILDDDLTADPDDPPQLRLGERAFEIVLSRKVAAGEEQTRWFERHRSTPTTEVPRDWPAAYRDLVDRRIASIEEHPLLQLVERPECKRRWASRTWEDLQSEALRGWLLDRLENAPLWADDNGPRVLSVAALADAIRADADLRSVLDVFVGRPDYDMATELTRLVKDEAVPYLASSRYKETGLRKRAVWEHVWQLQRLEDAGETVNISVPPKYTTADFKQVSYWRNRGKLDVPKERFILYPNAGRDGDRTPVLGWAAWDHLQQAQALARLVLDRQNTDGWDTTRIRPLLAGLLELEPWLGQWHHDYSATYGGSPADFYRAFLDDQLHTHSLTRSSVGNPTATDPDGKQAREH